MATSSKETGNESLSAYTSCEEHDNEQLEEFCTTHKVVLCRICVVTDHSACAKMPIKDKVKETHQQQSFDAFTKSLCTLKNKLESLSKMQDNVKRTMLHQIEECFVKVRRTREEINRHFDKIESELTDSIRKLEHEQIKNADSRSSACKHSIHLIEKEMTKLKNCRTIGDDEVKFICMQKSELVYKKLQQGYCNMEAAVKHNMQHDIVIDKMISKLTSTTKTIGQVVSWQNLDIPNGSEMWSTGGTFLPDGRLVACLPMPATLVLYAVNGIILSELKLESRIQQIAVISKDMLVGTVADKLEIHFVHVVDNSLSVVKKIKTDRPCYGIDVYKNKLYVTCFVGGATATGEVVVLSMEGKSLMRFNKTINNALFWNPTHICIDETSNMYVLDSVSRNVTILSKDGEPFEEINDVDCQAICRDSSNSRLFLVTSSVLNILVGSTHVPRRDLSNECGPYIQVVSYRHSDKALFVGSYGFKPKIFILD